jgi:cysteine-rich repeat protein
VGFFKCAHHMATPMRRKERRAARGLVELHFSTGSPSLCTTTCGDGVVAGPEEVCDDGNVINGDGCSSICSEEPGFDCVGSPSACAPVCGDGVVAGAEQCDDANVAAGDGCSSSCSVEIGYDCTGSPSVCTPVCLDNGATCGVGADCCSLTCAGSVCVP